MTLKEFAAKYEIPYNIVYESSYFTHPVSTLTRDRDYMEEDIMEACKGVLIRRIEKNLSAFERNRILLAKLKNEKDLTFSSVFKYD